MEITDALFNFELDTEAERTCQIYVAVHSKPQKLRLAESCK